MQIATLADLGELIEDHRTELLSEWHRELVCPWRGTTGRPTIIDHILNSFQS